MQIEITVKQDFPLFGRNLFQLELLCSQEENVRIVLNLFTKIVKYAEQELNKTRILKLIKINCKGNHQMSMYTCCPFK